MDKLDMIFTVIFVISTIIIMILIYYYNVRHKYEEPDELDEFVVEKKQGEKALYKSNDTFDWELYESDLNHDYDKFIGYDHYKNKESAEKRIIFLKDNYDKEKSLITLSMLESMMLIRKHGDDITLDSESTYRLKKIYLDDFISSLDYDIELIKLIQEIRDEMKI